MRQRLNCEVIVFAKAVIGRYDRSIEKYGFWQLDFVQSLSRELCSVDSPVPINPDFRKDSGKMVQNMTFRGFGK